MTNNKILIIFSLMIIIFSFSVSGSYWYNKTLDDGVVWDGYVWSGDSSKNYNGSLTINATRTGTGNQYSFIHLNLSAVNSSESDVYMCLTVYHFIYRTGYHIEAWDYPDCYDSIGGTISEVNLTYDNQGCYYKNGTIQSVSRFIDAYTFEAHDGKSQCFNLSHIQNYWDNESFDYGIRIISNGGVTSEWDFYSMDNSNVSARPYLIQLTEGCNESLVNTSWTDWVASSECFVNSSKSQQRNLTEYDENFCGTFENVTYYDYRSADCNFTGWKNVTIEGAIKWDTYVQGLSPLSFYNSKFLLVNRSSNAQQDDEERAFFWLNLSKFNLNLNQYENEGNKTYLCLYADEEKADSGSNLNAYNFLDCYNSTGEKLSQLNINYDNQGCYYKNGSLKSSVLIDNKDFHYINLSKYKCFNISDVALYWNNQSFDYAIKLIPKSYNWNFWNFSSLESTNQSRKPFIFQTLYINESCETSPLNTSWSSWSSYGSCQENSTIPERRYLTEYDSNSCGLFINKTFWEYRSSTYCEFCTASLLNTSWGSWYAVTSCFSNDTIINQHNLTEYDSNFCGTVENVTYYENVFDFCNYCSFNVSFAYGNWSDLNGSCGSRLVYSWDDNYNLCCFVSGLPSDCFEDDNSTDAGNYTEQEDKICIGERSGLTFQSNEFETVGQALFWIFIIGLWLILFLASVTLKGSHGYSIGILVITQWLFSMVIVFGFWNFQSMISFIIGLISTFTLTFSFFQE